MTLAEESPEVLARLHRLAELRRRDAMATRLEDPTPGHLARRLDPAIVQTPALELIDQHLVAVRDAIDIMYARRSRFAQLVAQGVEHQAATEQAALDIPSTDPTGLIISMPPQEGKSQRVTRYGILWLLRQFPGLRIGLVSYDGVNASQFSYQIRSDIEMFSGQGNTDIGLRLAPDQKAMGRWLLTTGGGVYAIGIGGGLTGRPLDLLVIDDPVKDVRAADSILQSAQAWEWWQTVARPRLAPWAPKIVVATRWHQADLSGRMIARQAEDEASGVEHFDRWVVLNIPAQADHDPTKGETDVLDREPGEFMASARGRTVADWMATMAATAARYWNALYQGRPTPTDGDVWIRTWWRRYEEPVWRLAEDGTYAVPGHDVSFSIDCAFRDTSSSDFVVIQVLAKRGAETFLVYQLRRRMSFTATVDQIRRIAALFPSARRKIIEAKANGDAVIDSLRKEIPGIIPANPTQSKTARAIGVSPFIRAGNVLLPTSACAMIEPELAWDVDAFIEEATAFPNGTHDDQVDAMSQYLEEAYLVGGEVTIASPEGRIPRTRPGTKPPVRMPVTGSRQDMLTRAARGR